MRVVVDDHHSIGRGVDVQLDPVRARRESGGERGESVLSLATWHAPVRDPEGRDGHRPAGGVREDRGSALSYRPNRPRQNSR
jgi:hypothetical protein